MANLAIIPARGGSKRIPKKNIKSFLGKPIIAYSIEVAFESGLFDKVMVSTEDDEVAEIARNYGAEVPFMRSAENSDDHAVLSDVMEEVLSAYYQNGIRFNNVCCILATAPFIKVEKLKTSYDKLLDESLDSVFPVLEFSFPIQRSLKIENNKVLMDNQEYLTARSQDLPLRYHDAGQFYWCDVDKFLKRKKLYTDNSGAIVISRLEAQDIDSETDWKIAEIKYKLMKDEGNTI